MASLTFFGTTQRQNLPEAICQNNYIRLLRRVNASLFWWVAIPELLDDDVRHPAAGTGAFGFEIFQ